MSADCCRSIYIAETVAPSQRGRLGCVPALLHAAGVLAAYVLGSCLPWHTVGRRQWTVLTSAN